MRLAHDSALTTISLNPKVSAPIFQTDNFYKESFFC